MAEKHDICIAINMPISGDPSKSEIDEIQNKLQDSERVSVIVSGIFIWYHLTSGFLPLLLGVERCGVYVYGFTPNSYFVNFQLYNLF